MSTFSETNYNIYIYIYIIKYSLENIINKPVHSVFCIEILRQSDNLELVENSIEASCFHICLNVVQSGTCCVGVTRVWVVVEVEDICIFVICVPPVCCILRAGY